MTSELAELAVALYKSLSQASHLWLFEWPPQMPPSVLRWFEEHAPLWHALFDAVMQQRAAPTVLLLFEHVIGLDSAVRWRFLIFVVALQAERPAVRISFSIRNILVSLA